MPSRLRPASLIFSKKTRAHDSSEGKQSSDVSAKLHRESRRTSVRTSLSSFSRLPSRRGPESSRRERRRHVQHVSRRTCTISHSRERHVYSETAPHLVPPPSSFPSSFSLLHPLPRSIHGLRGIHLQCIPRLKSRMHAMQFPSENYYAKDR